MVQFIMAIARTAYVPLWTRSKPRQASLINPDLMLLWDCDHELAQYLNNDEDVGFKLYLLPLLVYLNLVCNNF